MTYKECVLKLDEIEREYRQAQIEIREKYLHDRRIVLNTWAQENATYHVGDIIQSNKIVIIVEKIFGQRYVIASKATMVFIYQGHVLTNKLRLRKDGLKTSIQDEGVREIKLIRKAKEENL